METHQQEQDVDGLSPLLGIPVSPGVATPRATPPSPWAASTQARPENLGVLARAREAAAASGQGDTVLLLESRRVQFSCSDSGDGVDEAGHPSEPIVPGFSSAREDESIGILDPEMMEAASTLTVSESFAFPDLPAKGGKKSSPPVDQDDVFKIPALPPLRQKELSGIPAHLMTPGSLLMHSSSALFDSALSTDLSAANQSSFTWDKVASDKDASSRGADVLNTGDQEQVGAAARPTVGVSLDPGLPVGDEKFQELNKTENDSFATGQFSARSTSIGGDSSDGDGSRGARTRDDRFSDFSKVFGPAGAESRAENSNPFAVAAPSLEEAARVGPEGCDDDEGGEFPDDFGGLSQSLGEEFNAGDFRSSNDAHCMMDEAEKKFEDENKLVLYDNSGAVPEETKSDGFSNSSNSLMSSISRSDLLSQSGYFMQNTSTLGSLETEALLRPNLGFSKLVSPGKKKESGLDLIPEADSKNSTYTLSKEDDPSDSTKSVQLQASKFTDLDPDSLVRLISKASPNEDLTHYAQLIMKMKDTKKSAASPSTSQFLPSFLETSFADVTLTDDTKTEDDEDMGSHLHTKDSVALKADAKQVSVAENELKIPPKSKIPVYSPKSRRDASPNSSKSSQEGKSNASCSNDDTVTKAKRAFRGQRFSSPIKVPPPQDIQREKSTVKKKILSESEKENACLKQQGVSSAPVRRPALKSVDSNTQKQRGTTVKVSQAGPSGKSAASKPEQLKQPEKPRRFPLDTDRFVMTWIGVDIGRSEEQVVTLRNTTAEPVVANLMVRHSDVFKLGSSAASRVTLEPYGTASVAVTFSPASTALCQGKLVLKPQGFSTEAGGKAIKASISLQGQGGTPDIRLVNCGHLVNGKRSLHFGVIGPERPILTWEMEVQNRGSAPGFFVFQGFRDSDCRLADDYITVRPRNGVLREGTSQLVKLEVDTTALDQSERRGLFVGSLAAFYGPEICRQVMRKARLLPRAPKISSEPALLGVDFSKDFEGEVEDLFKGHVDRHDVGQFCEKTKKELVELTAQRKEEGAGVFRPLAAEETLSETRINCTVAQSPMKAKFDTIPEETVAGDGNVPPSTKTGGKRGRVPSPRTKTVYLETDKVFFPSTKAGSSSFCKIKIKNRTTSRQTVQVGKLSPPFFTKHREVVIQAMSFLSLPVAYRPPKTGNHEAVLTLVSSDGSLCTRLYGKSL